MILPFDNELWQGRSDPHELGDSRRWHDVIQPWSEQQQRGITLLGFACDEGVARNQGRVGARHGPEQLRSLLANTAWHHRQPAYDAGTVVCRDGDLLTAQQQLAQQVTRLLDHQQLPVVLGGGHEMAWGSFLGLANYHQQRGQTPRVGIFNIDAHFDLRSGPACSGTPFYQMAQYCQQQQQGFHYACLGINRYSNTKTLFERADKLNVQWRLDEQCAPPHWSSLQCWWQQFFASCDVLYLTICLDAFTSAHAPGVSAPAALGILPELAMLLINDLPTEKLALVDVAEYNPHYDIDHRTGRLAVRLINHILQHYTGA